MCAVHVDQVALFFTVFKYTLCQTPFNAQSASHCPSARPLAHLFTQSYSQWTAFALESGSSDFMSDFQLISPFTKGGSPKAGRAARPIPRQIPGIPGASRRHDPVVDLIGCGRVSRSLCLAGLFFVVTFFFCEQIGVCRVRSPWRPPSWGACCSCGEAVLSALGITMTHSGRGRGTHCTGMPCADPVSHVLFDALLFFTGLIMMRSIPRGLFAVFAFSWSL